MNHLSNKIEIPKKLYHQFVKSCDWINKNPFATVEMMPVELGREWIEIPPLTPVKPHSFSLPRSVFLYGLKKTYSILKPGSSFQEKDLLTNFFCLWQQKISLGLLFHLQENVSEKPLQQSIDHLPLFLFHLDSADYQQERWNITSKILQSLEYKKINDLEESSSNTLQGRGL
jgi:hypothetical protein